MVMIPTMMFTVIVCGMIDRKYPALGISFRSQRPPGIGGSEAPRPLDVSIDSPVLSPSCPLSWNESPDRIPGVDISDVSWMENEWL